VLAGCGRDLPHAAIWKSRSGNSQPSSATASADERQY
jgi:hypothetical protein